MAEKKPFWKTNLELFRRFFMIGLLTFGGGYSMLPMFERELVDATHWIDREELMDYFAIAQCTPGVIAVNCATFVGKKINRLWGAAFATLGVITPSLLIITLIAAFVTHFNEYPVVVYAFNGIRIAVAALIISAVIKLLKSAVKKPVGWVLYGVALAGSLLLNLSPVIYVVLGIAVSVVQTLLCARTPDDRGGKRS